MIEPDTATLVHKTLIDRFNELLFGMTFVLALYIICAPIIPEVMFQLRGETLLVEKFFGATEGPRVIVENISPVIGTPLLPNPSYPQDNRLVIPKIGIDGLINEGTTNATLQKGIWRRPHSSTPDVAGNTVLVAHRFLYTTGTNTFYHLDKMQVGDTFDAFWKGYKYSYEVTDVSVVPPTDVTIEQDSLVPMMTLYTCTPLWTAKNRLVVRAKLIAKS